MIQKIMNRRFAVVSGLVIMNALGFANVARAGEGGIAGSAAFTVSADKVTGVAVSAAVGKDSAIAHAFNYILSSGTSGLQNAAFAIGSAGATTSEGIGSATFKVTGTADAALGTAQANTISNGYSIQLGTSSGNVVNQVPAASGSTGPGSTGPGSTDPDYTGPGSTDPTDRK